MALWYLTVTLFLSVGSEVYRGGDFEEKCYVVRTQPDVSEEIEAIFRVKRKLSLLPADGGFDSACCFHLLVSYLVLLFGLGYGADILLSKCREIYEEGMLHRNVANFARLNGLTSQMSAFNLENIDSSY
jgi:hypothetical protein